LIGTSIVIVITKTTTSNAPAAENMTHCVDTVRNADQINPMRGSKRNGGIVLVNSLFSA